MSKLGYLYTLTVIINLKIWWSFFFQILLGYLKIKRVYLLHCSLFLNRIVYSYQYLTCWDIFCVVYPLISIVVTNIIVLVLYSFVSLFVKFTGSVNLPIDWTLYNYITLKNSVTFSLVTDYLLRRQVPLPYLMYVVVFIENFLTITYFFFVNIPHVHHTKEITFQISVRFVLYNPLISKPNFNISTL